MSMQYKRLPVSGGCLHPVFLPLALLLGFYIFRSVSMPLSDFAGYYFGGRPLLSGDFMGAYDMEKLNFAIARSGIHDVFVSYAPFPPFTSLVFAPFLLFPPGTARLVFDCFSSLFFLFTLMRFRVFMRIAPLPMLLVPVIFYIPILNNLYFGQSYLLLCALLLEGFMAYRREKIVVSSLLWGLAIVFKIFPALILFFLLLRKKYRQAVFLCAACLLLLLVSVGINGFAAWKYYLTEILPKVNNGELNDSFTFMFQSAFMLFKRLFVFDGLLNPHPLSNIPWLFGILTGLFKALILSACVVYTLRKKDIDSFALWIMGSMLISPNGSSYSLVLLVIPLLSMMARRKGTGVLPVLILLAACWVPVYRLEHLPVWEQFPRLYLLLLFFGFFVGTLRPAWTLCGGLSLLFIGLFFIGYARGSDDSVYFLPKEEHIFIYDYSIRDGQLFYSCWEGDGVHTISTGFPVTDTSSGALEIRDKQIVYRGKRLTASPDAKKKPMLINRSFILYLSDKNRGPGFYTLRKLVPSGG